MFCGFEGCDKFFRNKDDLDLHYNTHLLASQKLNVCSLEYFDAKT